jgi:hypothetical protein
MAQGGCVSGQEGRALVAEGRVMPFPEAARRAGIADNDVVAVDLCRSGGGFVYRVRLRQGGETTIPAS